MSKIYYFNEKKYTIALVDNDRRRYLKVSAFSSKDGSAYLIINSGVKFNYNIKFSYHPKERSLKYAFTSELWSALDKVGLGKPNKERIKSKIINLEGEQLLCYIFIDRSALYKGGVPGSKDLLSINFKNDRKIFKMVLSLENSIIHISHSFIDNNLVNRIEAERKRIYSIKEKLNPSEITGIAQLMNDSEFPWKLLCIGI